MKRSKSGAIGLALIVAWILFGMPTRVAAQSGPTFPSVNGNFSASGPFLPTIREDAATGAHTIFRPATLGAGGLRHPVILWGNGTGTPVGFYGLLLRHFASHGFIVIAADTGTPGSGVEMLAGAAFLIAENARPGSPFFQKIDVNRIGATGHSQGGGGAINAGASPMVDTVAPIEPGIPGNVLNVLGPLLLLAAEKDLVVPPATVLARFDAADQVPTVYGELRDANHLTPVLEIGGGFRGIATAWFRFWLMGDEQARGVFFGPESTCGLCNDIDWTVVLRNTLALSIPGPS